MGRRSPVTVPLKGRCGSSSLPPPARLCNLVTGCVWTQPARCPRALVTQGLTLDKMRWGAGARGLEVKAQAGAGGSGDEVRAQAGFPVGWRFPPLLK